MSESHKALGIATGDGHEHHVHRAKMMRRALIGVVILLVLLGLGALRTVVARVLNHHMLTEQTQEQTRQYVTVISPSVNQEAKEVDLPGTLQGVIESPIYARTSGYLLSWQKDIGARVAKGDLLATLATPEVDQQLSQAVAARAQTAASLQLARTSAERWNALRQKDAVSQQELDERQSAYLQAQANDNAALANVRRNEQLESFRRIVAPFEGVITRRNVDIGDLIDAGASARALFTMAKADPLRVYVYVPQADAERVKTGDPADVSQPELAQRQFHGRIVRTAGAIDTGTRTLQVEVQLPNPDGALLPGAYVNVKLHPSDHAALTVPVNTMLFRSEGPSVAVVDGQSVARLKKVTIGRDYGETVEIVGGLSKDDRIIVNPPDSLVDGQPVSVEKPSPPNTPVEGASSGIDPSQKTKGDAKGNGAASKGSASGDGGQSGQADQRSGSNDAKGGTGQAGQAGQTGETGKAGTKGQP